MALTKQTIVEKKIVDPKHYGLPPRTVLIKMGQKEFIIVIKRKSRIIMKDALMILKKAEIIKTKISGASVELEITAPICSKSIKFLKENGIKILKEIQD
mgnify:CR=1 FL=1